MIVANKVVDGQNISLVEAIGLGFKRLDDQQFELVDGKKKFVLSGLVGVVREISVVEEDENVQAGNSANGVQEIKESTEDKIEKQVQKGEDPVVLAPQPIKEKDLNKEEDNFREALQMNGFNVVNGEDGSQSGKNKKSNKKL